MKHDNNVEKFLMTEMINYKKDKLQHQKDLIRLQSMFGTYI